MNTYKRSSKQIDIQYSKYPVVTLDPNFFFTYYTTKENAHQFQQLKDILLISDNDF
jgi:hypothetical protein